MSAAIYHSNIPSIPTRYGCVQFRSRLEARWAAFFDFLDLRWHYEPIDLEGYIPDFIIATGEVRVLVEVKPAATPADMRHAAAKIDRTTWADYADQAVVVGSGLDVELFKIGLHCWRGRRERWTLAWLEWCDNCHRTVISGDGVPDRNRCPFGGRLSGPSNPSSDIDVENFWREAWLEAGNLVQWRSPRGGP